MPLRSRDTADSIFLASFIPLAEGSRWPGNLDHYILPLPVVENDDGQLVPDPSVTCADGEDTGCLAWRAGTEILEQAPTAGEVATDRRIGLTENERRVTYTRRHRQRSAAHDPRLRLERLRRARRTSTTCGTVSGIPTSPVTRRRRRSARPGSQHINETLQIRETTDHRPRPAERQPDLEYVAGDFFHADPVIVGAPQNFFYLANDLEGNGAACDDTANPNHGYRCFFEQNQRRRRVLVAAVQRRPDPRLRRRRVRRRGGRSEAPGGVHASAPARRCSPM